MGQKIYIALVGGQMMPVFLGVRKVQPDKIVLIHSDTSKKEAETIQKVFVDRSVLRCFHPVDYMAIRESAMVLLDEFSEGEIFINVTSETKPWTLAFTLLSQEKVHITLLYIDQNGVCYDCTHYSQWEAEKDLDMTTLMQYNGQIPEHYSKLSDYMDKDLKILKSVKKLHRRNTSDFNILTIPDKSWKRQLAGGNDGMRKIKSGSSIKWNRAKQTVHIELINRHGIWSEYFCSPHVFQLVFNSGWFEYEIAMLLSRWQQAREVWMNVIFPYRNSQPKNEIDVVVNMGNKFLMVECKTPIFDNTDIDKFRTAVKNYGGMGCKALFYY